MAIWRQKSRGARFGRHASILRYPLCEFKNKNEHTEYHDGFIPFKSQVYSKHGSPIFLLFTSWNLASYFHKVKGEGKVSFNKSNLTNLVGIQR